MQQEPDQYWITLDNGEQIVVQGKMPSDWQRFRDWLRRGPWVAVAGGAIAVTAILAAAINWLVFGWPVL